MGIKDQVKGAFALFESKRPAPESAATQLSTLKVIRNFARVEFALALLASIALPILLVTMGAETLPMLSTVWYFIIAPAVFSGAAMLVYFSRSVSRPWMETLGELAFWLTFPFGATLFLFAVQWNTPMPPL